MKKRLFFLPMVAIMMAACSSNETIEVNENKGDLISFRPIVKGVTLPMRLPSMWRLSILARPQARISAT